MFTLKVSKGRMLCKPPLHLSHTYRPNHLLGVNQPPQRTITYSPSPQKDDFKEVLPLMSLRATQVYRHGDRSQVDFKHQSDPNHLENLHYTAFGEIKFFLDIRLGVFFFFLWFKVGFFVLLTIFLWLLRQKVQMCFG